MIFWRGEPRRQEGTKLMGFGENAVPTPFGARDEMLTSFHASLMLCRKRRGDKAGRLWGAPQKKKKDAERGRTKRGFTWI